MKRFQIKRIIKIKNSLLLAGLIAGGILLGCAAEKQVIQVTPPVQTSISGTVVSDTGKTISEAKVVAHWTERKVNKSKEVMSGLDGSFVLELPTRPFKLEASKAGYFDATIEKLDAGAILSGLKLVLKSGGIIKVTIIGLEEKELQFCDVKAIASEQEYLAAKKFVLLVPFKKDASTGGVQANQKGPFSGLFTIEGVPVGPAEVRVRLLQENLPAQTVEVKGGTEVRVLFKFTSNKVVLSGKVTQLGNPVSEWLLMFRPTDGKPAPVFGAAQTDSDGSYSFKLNPGAYEIKLSKPSIGKIQGVTTKVWSTMFTTTYTVTKTGTLNLEVSTLKKIESKKSAQTAQTQEPFAIKDKRLLQLSDRDPCHTDAEITASNSQGYQTRGIVEVFGGQYHLWCNGAKHTWIGRHENIQGAIAVIDSDKENPLQFRIDKEKGYVYQKGKGTVTMPDRKMITLPMSMEVTPYAQEKSPDRLVSEKFVTQIISSQIPKTFKVSPDGKHVAYWAKLGNKYFVVIDGKEEKQYDGIGSLIFSPDSKRVAYGTGLSNRGFVVVDGEEEKQYDGIGTTLVFSPDSKRVAYVAEAGNKRFVVVDGKQGKQYDGIGQGSLIFSPDSKRVAFWAEAGKKQFVVVDGKEERQCDGIGSPVFSPDSKRVVYVAEAGKKQFVVVDGKEERQYDGIGSPVFSPDSKRVVYVAEAGKKQFVVVDGKEERQYDGIGSLIFSPDSKRVAYVAEAGNKWFVVVDGKQGKQYDGIGQGSLIFSPDSRRMAYLGYLGFTISSKTVDKPFVVEDGKQWFLGVEQFVVVDGKEEKRDVKGTPIFSPDSKRVAYVAEAGKKQFVVVDAKEEKQYDGIGDLIFSPDSKRVAYTAETGNKWCVLVNGREGKQYDNIFGEKGGKTIFFDTAVSLHYLAQKVNSIYLVEENIE